MNQSNMLFAITIALFIAISAEISEVSNSTIQQFNSDKFKEDIISGLSSKLDQRLDEMLEKLEQRIEPLLTTDNKQILPIQQSINDDQLETCISCQCKQINRPRSCAEAFKLSANPPASGIYQLYLSDFSLKPFDVYCLQDPHNDDAWTIIQRRQDNSTDFYRTWDDYKRGFGNLNTNYFIGLDRLHAMTHAQSHELWVQLEDFEGETRYAKYENFAIGDEADKYALNTLGAFSGNAGDSMAYQKGMKFTTLDNDNDKWDVGNCAHNYKGGYWYNFCLNSNLNGLYLRGKGSEYAKGIAWWTWHNLDYSLKYVHMAIRPNK